MKECTFYQPDQDVVSHPDDFSHTGPNRVILDKHLGTFPNMYAKRGHYLCCCPGSGYIKYTECISLNFKTCLNEEDQAVETGRGSSLRDT